MNDRELRDILSKGESLVVEFKSDVKSLPDRDLIAAVVAMANTEGGLILLGVEDDGEVTGVQPNHQDAPGLAAYIDKHGTIKRSDVADLCHLNPPQAYRLLKKLKEPKKIKQMGEKRFAVYARVLCRLYALLCARA